MSKFREAVKAGQVAYRNPGNKSQVLLYICRRTHSWADQLRLRLRRPQRNQRDCVRDHLVGYRSDILMVLVSLETKHVRI